MMSEAQLWESNALRNLRHVSEARGMTFYVNPPREVVPEFLGDIQPTAIAVGPDGGIVIEVQIGRNPAHERQLAAISRRVSDQKGWEFRAIYLNQPPDETPSIEKPTPEQLRATFEEIEALAKGGHSAAGLVMGWAALESLARLASAYRETGRPADFSPLQAIHTLAEEGYVEHEVAERLRGIAKLRTAVVHGDLSIDVPVEQVEDLLGQLRAIEADIMSVMAG